MQLAGWKYHASMGSTFLFLSGISSVLRWVSMLFSLSNKNNSLGQIYKERMQTVSSCMLPLGWCDFEKKLLWRHLWLTICMCCETMHQTYHCVSMKYSNSCVERIWTYTTHGIWLPWSKGQHLLRQTNSSLWQATPFNGDDLCPP